MTKRLEGKTALITAAGRGIGHSTALAFAREGARVIATGPNEESLKHLQAVDPGIDIRILNVTDSAAATSLCESMARVDVLFNCAGHVHQGTLLDCSEQDWDYSFDLNVKSMYRLMYGVIPKMLAVGGGSIINMSSVVSSIKGVANRCLYGATKAAVIGLTKAVAADYVGEGIRCNAICPGTIETPSMQSRVSNAEDPDQAMKDFITRQPMGRLGTADEVASLAVYLASDESTFTTGTVHVIDGGMSI